MERQLLNLIFNSRIAWSKIKDHLKESEFSPQGWILVGEISTYYEMDDKVNHCSGDILLSRLTRKYPKADIFQQIIGSFKEEVSESNILKELYDFKRHNVKQQLATKLLDEKREDSDSIIKLYEEYTKYAATPSDGNEEADAAISVAPSVADIVHSLTNPDSVIKLYPKSLNAAIGGGVPKQSHIIVYGSPEVGKSAVWINQAVGSARDGHKVLVLDNEDPASSTWARVQSRITGMTKQEMYNDPDKAQELLDTCGFYDKILILSKSPGTISELHSLCEEHKPDLLIVNQIRHLYFKGIDGDVAQLTAAGKAMRSLVKKHNIVGISITQAADSASNKAVLDIGDVYMSNVSLPGDADILMGIGASPDMKSNGMRMLSLAKNKLNGNHEPVCVAFNEQLSKFTSL